MSNFARVRGLYIYGYDIGKGILISLLMCLLGTSNIHAAPTHTCPQKIDINKVGFCNSNGTFYEWECYSCPPGLGQSIECGWIYYEPFKVECLPCKKGIQYSDKYDHSQCEPCTHCSENEIQSGQCETDKDTTSCRCKAGYYRDTLTRACQPCSWCCNDNKTNQQHVPECKNLAKKCSFETTKSCGPTTLPPSTLPTTPTPPPTSPTTTTRAPPPTSSPTTTPTPPPTSPTTTTPTTKHHWTEESVFVSDSGPIRSNDLESTSHKDSQKMQKEPTVNTILFSTVPAVVLLIVISLALCHCRKRSTSDNNSAEITRSTSSTSTSNDLDSSASSSAPFLPKDNEKGESIQQDNETTINLILISDTVQYSKEGEKVPLVTAPERPAIKEDSLPETSEGVSDVITLESSLIGCTCTCDIQEDITQNTTGQLSKEEALNLLVTELPLEIYGKVCTRLDTENDFFHDYRMLAEELGFSNDRIRILQQKKSQPTQTLLIEHQLKIKKFLLILKAIEREDVMEIIETWLDQL